MDKMQSHYFVLGIVLIILIFIQAIALLIYYVYLRHRIYAKRFKIALVRYLVSAQNYDVEKVSKYVNTLYYNYSNGFLENVTPVSLKKLLSETIVELSRISDSKNMYNIPLNCVSETSKQIQEVIEYYEELSVFDYDNELKDIKESVYNAISDNSERSIDSIWNRVLLNCQKTYWFFSGRLCEKDLESNLLKNELSKKKTGVFISVSGWLFGLISLSLTIFALWLQVNS